MRLWSSTTSVMLIKFGLVVLHSALSTDEHAGLQIQQHLFVWFTFELSKSQLPYWFRPIESGQLGFWNLTSHFIFIQIFQRDFSTLPLILTVSNYYRYICWGQNEYLLKMHWPLSCYRNICQRTQEGKGDELNPTKRYLYLTEATCAQIFTNQYLFF